MPTPTEHRALLFFSAVLLLGAGARVVGSPDDPVPPVDAQERVELHRQIASVDSARRQGKGSRRRGRGGASRAAEPGSARTRGSGSVWPDDSAPAAAYYLRPSRQKVERLGDGGTDEAFAPGVDTPARIDVDAATAAEIERLPRIGPALARRIVADREANGPFGSLDALTRVRGIGPGISRAIAPYVTFTGTPRPLPEGGADSGGAGGRARRLRKPRIP